MPRDRPEHRGGDGLSPVSDTRPATRRGPLQVQIAAGAASGEPDLADLQRTTDEERLIGTTFVARRVEALGALAAGLTVEQARDRIWALNSVGLWHLLTSTRGWSGDEYAAWIGDQMCAAVLARPADQGAPRSGR